MTWCIDNQGWTTHIHGMAQVMKADIPSGPVRVGTSESVKARSFNNLERIMSSEEKRAKLVLSSIDGRPAVTGPTGFTSPVRDEETAKKFGAPLSPFPHLHPGGHKTDLVNIGTTPKGFPIMQRVSDTGGTGSKSAADPITGHTLKLTGGEAVTDKPMFPQLSPRTMGNKAPRFDTFK